MVAVKATVTALNIILALITAGATFRYLAKDKQYSLLSFSVLLAINAVVLWL